MTGATVVWFGRRRRTPPPVDMTKASNLVERREAEQAVRDARARSYAVFGQRGAVARAAASLAEVRQANHFADGIRAAMGGGDQR